MSAPAGNLGEGSGRRKQADSTAPVRFLGTDNPRQLRALRALAAGPVSREQLDRTAGCSNGPELIAKLRRRGLDIRCEMARGKDRDGRPCRFGCYELDANSRAAVVEWLRGRQQAGYLSPHAAIWLAALAAPAVAALPPLLRALGWL